MTTTERNGRDLAFFLSGLAVGAFTVILVAVAAVRDQPAPLTADPLCPWPAYVHDLDDGGVR